MNEAAAGNAELTDILVNDLKLNASLLQPDATLTAAGLDSLSAVELSLLLRDRYGLDVTETDLHQTTTLFDLHQLIETKRAAIHTTPSGHQNIDRGAR